MGGKEKKSKKDRDRKSSKKRKHREDPQENTGPLITKFKRDPDADTAPPPVVPNPAVAAAYERNVQIKLDPDRPLSEPEDETTEARAYPRYHDNETNPNYFMDHDDTVYVPTSPSYIPSYLSKEEPVDIKEEPDTEFNSQSPPPPQSPSDDDEPSLPPTVDKDAPGNNIHEQVSDTPDENDDVDHDYVRASDTSEAVRNTQNRKTEEFNDTNETPSAAASGTPVERTDNLSSTPEIATGPNQTQTKREDSENSPDQPKVTNVFHLSSLPLPQVKRPAKTELEALLNRTPEVDEEQVRREKKEAAELEYARAGPPQPIVYHDEEADEEEEEEDADVDTGMNADPGPNASINVAALKAETTTVIGNNQRYFKQRGIPRKYNFKHFKYPEMKNLAVYQHKDQILDSIIKNHIVVVEGFTGCGKTTQVPQFILDYCIENEQVCDIVVTQPRRIATISVCRRVCEERGWELGTVVGYQVGMDKQLQSDTLVTYMTTGVLLQKLINDRSLKRYTHIIIDEVHERDLETDFLLLIIKKILMEDKAGKERHVKIVLMSATLNAQKFSEYFSLKRHKNGDPIHAPVIKIPLAQSRFVVQENYLEDQMVERDIKELEFNREKAVLHSVIYDAAVKTILNLDIIDRTEEVGSNRIVDPRYVRGGQTYEHMKPKNRGSVLVFLPGFVEIDTMAKRLESATNRDGKLNIHQWTIIPLHSTITNEEQQKAFSPTREAVRKIILATNIAESSITVPDIVYVVDFCLTKSLDVDPRTNFSCLRTVWASLSQCIQRKGRTGRVREGKVFRLVPKDFYHTMEKDTVPEMLRAGLESVIVRVKTFNMGSPKHMLSLAIDTPLLSGIERAIVNLKELGGLTMQVTDKDTKVRYYDTCDGDLTFLGKLMSQLPVPHQCVRLIMLGHAFCVLKECVIIAAGLSVKSPFTTSFHHRLEAYLTKFTWSQKGYSDCLAILHLYNDWDAKFNGPMKARQEKNWARMTHVQISGLREMRNLVDELSVRLKKLNIIPFPFPVGNKNINPGDGLSKEQLSMIKIAIAGAFYPNYFCRLRPSKNYEREKYKEINGGDLFNTVYFKGFHGGHCSTLYGGIIAEKYAFGAGIPKVTFSGQKALVEFDSTTERIGPISKSVYQAIKKRQLREKMEFYVLPREQEAVYFAQQERILKNRSQYYTPCPSQVQLPPIHIQEFPVSITYVESPSQFWVVYSKNDARLEDISRGINCNMRPKIPLREEQIGPGALCLAPFVGDEDDKNVPSLYYRAKIRSVDHTLQSKRRALVYFVDYGNSQWFDTRDLCGFNDAHVGIGLTTELCLAVECRLASIKPSVLYGSVWHNKAIEHMKDFAQSQFPKKLKVHNVCKSVVAGILYGLREEPDGSKKEMNANKKLVDQGFAEIVQENAECSMNYDIRKRAGTILRNGDTDQFNAHNKGQEADVHDITYVQPPYTDQSKMIKMELKGPWSPLELGFESLCHSSNSKEVSIDDTSVNSVALDHEPAAPASRLVVAASVSIQDKSGRVIARDTTMMPALPGLMSLIAMIFAPQIELRVDRYRTYYTGVLCGLGADTDNTPIYQDHDMEIIFDTAIVDDDIQLINKVRHFMNLILRENGNLNCAQAHIDIVKRMFELMMKKRDQLAEAVWPQDTYAWAKILPEHIVPPGPLDSPLTPLDIFPPHSTVRLLDTAAPEVDFADFAI